MTLAPTEYRGIVSLNQSLVQELTGFLREREGYLADALKQAFAGTLEPIRPEANTLALALNSLQSAHYIPATTASLPQLQHDLNTALWSFVEVLEGGVTELFEQLDETRLQDWDDQLADVLGALVSLFQNHLQGTMHAIDRLEDILWKCRDYMQIGKLHTPWLRQLLRCGRSLLDSQIGKNLDKALSFLNERYRNWHKRYVTYVNFNSRAAEATYQLDGLSLFETLPQQSQDIYRYVLRMIKLWEIDAGAKAVLLDDVRRAIRDTVHSDTVFDVFHHYYNILKDALFTTSKEIKVGGDTLPLADIGLHSATVRKEVEILRSSIARYREFLLRTDPNPYVRSRWGFPEWVVGPEPESCRQLLKMEFQIEALDRLYASFSTALMGKADESRETTQATVQDIQRSLHALGQPLLSRHLMLAEGGRLMDKVDRFDELASTHPRAIDFVGDILLRALRYDTKFSLLPDNTTFHKVYAIHHGLAADLISDPAYQQSVETCKLAIGRILKWLKKDHADKQSGDVDQLHEQVSQQLTTLYDTIQGLSSEKRDAISATRQKLLELRYLLNDFYHRLNSSGMEGRQLRSRFITLDHQIEAVETQLQNLDSDVIHLQ